MEAKFPSWSHDSKSIGFIGQSDGHSNLFLVDSDGHNSRKIAADVQLESPPKWSPDDKKVAWVDSNSFHICILNIVLLKQSCLENTSAPNGFDWSPDSHRLVFGSLEIFVVDENGENMRNLTKDKVKFTYLDGHEGFTDSSFPAWSPDGKLIAFSSGPGGSKDSIYIMNPDGENIKRLSKGSNPVWSSDSKKIASSFVANDLILGMTKLDSGDFTELAILSENCCSNTYPHRFEWSPDSNFIVYVRYTSTADIYIVNVLNQSQIQLTDPNSEAWNWDPDWSIN